MSIISIGYTGEFKEKPTGNYVDGLPSFLLPLIDARGDSSSPLRAFLDGLAPGHIVNVQITMQVIPAPR